MAADFKKVWLVFVLIEAQEGHSFNDLVDSDVAAAQSFIGAWANVLVKTNDIDKAIDIARRGLDEKKFVVIFIDKIENVASLVEYKELDESIIQEAMWLLSTDFAFMISGEIFPYAE
jgi:hypothetical protein